MPPETKPTGLEKPVSAGKPVQDASSEPVIHVIPENFYGAGLKMKAPAVPAAPAAAPGLPKPPAPPAKKKSVLPIVIIGVLLLAVIGAAAFYFARPAAPAPAANVNAVTVPQAVCGDAKCDASETTASCPADCPAPAPTCGDGTCDTSSETTASCPADCKPPASACGDGKCDATTETADSCPADCKPPEPQPGTDTDSDGLSDQEEKEVFGTNPASPNTDKDNYVDLNEVLNLYDPASPTPALLKDNPHIAAYANAANGYSLLRPAAWKVTESTEDSGLTTFNAPSGEFVSVDILDKPVAQGIMDWYLAQAPGVTSSQLEPYKTKQGYDAVLSPDRMTAYVDLGAKVAVVSYKLANQPFVQYRVTFQMMVQSLAAVPVK